MDEIAHIALLNAASFRDGARKLLSLSKTLFKCCPQNRLPNREIQPMMRIWISLMTFILLFNPLQDRFGAPFRDVSKTVTNLEDLPVRHD
jgi:hypothetical protein